MPVEPETAVPSPTEMEQLRQTVEDLIQIMHLQARELEKLVAHVEQVAGHHLGYQDQFSLVASELTGLHHRIQKLRFPQ